MSTYTTPGGTKIFCKDWGSGRPVVFSHGWPLSADAWDAQMQFLASNGCRVIAHDRRGHGRSDQTWEGNTMDQYVAASKCNRRATMTVVRIDRGAPVPGAGGVDLEPGLLATAANERGCHLLAQARTASLEHLEALQKALAEARALSEGVVRAGDLYTPGLHDFAKRLGDELLCRSRMLEALTERQRVAARTR